MTEQILTPITFDEWLDYLGRDDVVSSHTFYNLSYPVDMCHKNDVFTINYDVFPILKLLEESGISFNLHILFRGLNIARDENLYYIMVSFTDKKSEMFYQLIKDV